MAAARTALKPAATAPVFVRVKPFGKGKTGTSETRGSLRVADEGGFSLNGKGFTFPTAVIGDGVDQEGAYGLGDVESYVSDFLDGVDVNVLAYGQTGSGKTHTTFGPPGLMERAGRGEFGTETIPEYGLFPRAIFSILDRVQELRAAGRTLVLTASCVELSYGMNLDMLFGKMPAFTDMQLKPAKLFGQAEMSLGTRDDALAIFAALATRNSRATLMNDSSSRSHCFVTLTLRESTDGNSAVRESRLQFVDMAGSERLKDAHGKTMGYEGLASNMGYAEGLATNYSLMMLSQCIRDVAKQKNPTTMSFRAYKIDLVFLLQASLMGSARTILYVCLHQSAECDGQSYNACDFGHSFSTIRIRPTRRAARSVAELRKQSEREQKEAEAALAKGCVGRDPRSYADIKDIRQAQGAAEQRFGLDTTDWAKEFAKSVEAQRKEFAEGMQYIVAHSKANRRYTDQQMVAEYEIDCGQFGGDNAQLRVLVHTPKGGGGSGGERRRGLVYFHGGGGIVGSARDYSTNGVCPRIACDANLVVVNVDYRLAPEAKVPAAIMDGACAVRWAFAHASDLGIDANRIAVGGESGGGYVAVGACAELAKRGETARVALLVAISPQTSNFFRRMTPAELDQASPNGLRLDLYKNVFDFIGEMMLGGATGSALKKLKKHDDDPLLYPNLMDDATATAMPKTVVFTSEFDMLRVGAEELAEKLERHGRLVDYVCHPRCTHVWWMMMDHKSSPTFWGDLAKVFAKWL